MNATISLPADVWDQILCQAMAGAPLEICGLVSLDAMGGFHVYPVDNELRSPVRFRMAPQEMLNAFLKMEEGREELFAIYHSHPSGPAVPSETDRVEDVYPQVVKLISACQDGKWTLNGFRLETEGYRAIALELA